MCACLHVCVSCAITGTLATLKSYGHCKGILVYDDTFAATSAGWSPDARAPNAQHGLPFDAAGERPLVAWNPVGTGVHWDNVDFPVFHLLDKEVAAVMAVRARR